MKNNANFWLSFEKYIRKIFSRSPLSYTYIVLVLVLFVIAISIINVKNSTASITDLQSLIGKSVEQGDYRLARNLLEEHKNKNIENRVLGVESELEDRVYPERKVERRIIELESKLDSYPGFALIFRSLSKLYRQLGNEDLQNDYAERARILDPNGENNQ